MKSGNINFIDTELTNEQFASLGYPALYILKNSSNTVTKFIIFDLNGVRTDYVSGSGVTEEWVNAQISTAIAGLQDNRLEFNEFSDFPAIGDETKFYIDLTQDKIYIWDSYSQTYKNQSWDTATIASIQASIASAQMAFQNLQNSKLDKGTYNGTASDLKTEIDGKLNKPTTTGNTTTHPFVVGEDGNGNSARLPAGDLGKNFFNADLVNTTARTHTMNAGITVKTLGNPHTLSGLPNKNADISNFRKVRVQNASGLDAVVDSKNMLLDMPSYLTEQERTAWKTAMNGGWTTNTMSVALISPFIIKNDNNDNWVLLKGANLNLPPTSFEVAIMNEAGTSVVAIVPNNQVQLYTNGTDLIFYYNFFNLGLGKYKIRLWNGVAYYITNSKLTITDTITNIPFQQGEIRLVSGSSSINVATAYEVILKPDPNIKAQPTNALNSLSDIVSNWVDGNVLQGNEDWWVQLSVECIAKQWYWGRIDIANVGLSSSSSSSSLLSPTVGGILIFNQSTTHEPPQPPDISIIGGNTLNDLANGSQINYIKIGSVLQILLIASNGTIVSMTTTIDTSQNYRLVANCNNQPNNNEFNWHTGIKLTKVRISNI